MGQQWDEEYDVVVVGSGAGALTGAHLAARAGRSVVVVEKTDRVGGMASYSGAALWLPGTQVQERAGVGDSTEAARTYLRAVLGPAEAAKQDAFVEAAPAVVAALEEDPAVEFAHQVFPDYFDRPGRIPGGRSIIPVDIAPAELGELLHLVRPPASRDRVGLDHSPEPLTRGRALIARLLLAFARTGRGVVHTGTCVDELVTDGDRVIGIAAERGGRRVRIGARQAVLLAAGGFEHDAGMRDEHGVAGEAAWSMAPDGTNTGEPLRAAMALGAATDLMHEAWWGTGLAMPDGTAGFIAGFAGGLVVDGRGHRYTNESLSYERLAREMAADPVRTPSYALFDHRTGGHLPAVVVPAGRPEEHLAAGTWTKADTLAELAESIGVAPEELTATVERYNRFAESGTDEDFGREADEYGRWFGEPVLVPVDRPPYYAAKLVLADLGTKGGLVIDVAGRVLRADGTAIPGLYAAGNTSASFTGAFYPGPGTPIATAMVFAALAVQDVLGAYR
ncbi:FAD-dependent oxidoreductase [Saccharopolyspora cebuensis]|uniref:FAD-dependent oxidoreductase n=1 Tax=Saccharopolyspora cebuensis TaxID=418759 RepID=A0ABV4CGE7_9PSEU